MSKQPRDETVGFIGLGMMGQPMATNIMKKGHRLVAYDVASGALDKIASLGAKAATGPRHRHRRHRIAQSCW